LKSAQLKYAQILLKMFMEGDGMITAKDVIYWYSKAVTSGSKKARMDMARFYLHQDEQGKKLVERKPQKAAELLLPLQDKPEALKQLVQLIDHESALTNDPTTLKLILEKADASLMTAGTIALASRLETGSPGFEKNLPKAIELYEKAARGNDDPTQSARAMGKLGEIYELNGVAKYETVAFDWYTKAANAGDTESMGRLGVIYWKGLLGQKINQDVSVEWFLKAARNGNQDAKKSLAFILGSDDSRASADEKLEWFTLAANEDGLRVALYKLGRMYQMGRVLEIDFKLARKWYEAEDIMSFSTTLERFTTRGVILAGIITRH
jgi:TPR repeat protein